MGPFLKKAKIVALWAGGALYLAFVLILAARVMFFSKSQEDLSAQYDDTSAIDDF